MSSPMDRVKQVAASLVSSFNDDSGLPTWDELKEAPGTNYKCAWGLFDKVGGTQVDQVGTLNLLTPERVLNASRTEIRTGESISLNWGLENVKYPGFGRAPMKQKIIDLNQIGFCGHDDEVSFNTQCGSQWDGLRHVAHQGSKTYYNNLKHEDVASKKDLRNGLENVNDRGGVCGRGVLLDWVAYAERHGIAYNPISRQEIPITDLEACAKEQGVQFQVGDILFVRSGFVKWHNNATDEERKAGTKDASNYIGVKADQESFKWHWNNHFAAVVGDTVAWEAWPPSSPMLHEYLLAMYGCLIGEMWDLEALAVKCKKENRYSFFVTSAPLNVQGGIGSPPNALAIF